MQEDIFDALGAALRDKGADAAIDLLCSRLRESKDYANLFYALLLKKRHELGVSPVPTESAQSLPEAVHEPYEEAIRQAGRQAGNLFLGDGDIPRAWLYFRMLGEPEPIARALENYQPKGDDDFQALIDIAYHQGVDPRKGFDWILERNGICNAITTVSGTEFPKAEVRDHCIRRLVNALHEQLRQRLADDIANHDGTAAPDAPIPELIAGRDWLFADEFSYHVDVSHLASIVQMSIHLTGGREIGLARELCVYGSRLSARLRYPGDPPFEDQYQDYGIYLAILAGDHAEEGIAHFRKKVETADPETVGIYPAVVLVNLLVRLERPAEALAIARRYLARPEDQRPGFPSIPELCRLANDYQPLAEVARRQGDPVHFMAGLLAREGVRGQGSGVREEVSGQGSESTIRN
jgi:hypothetical protein